MQVLPLWGLRMHSSCWKNVGTEDPPLPRLRNVFVYGSLLAPEVVSALIDRVPRTAPAYVPHYHRHSIKGRLYPAAIPFPEDKVYGKVLFDLTDQELAVLDEFEDIEYIKEIVEPVLTGHGKEVETGPSSALQAYMYVWADVKDENLQGEWDYEDFRGKYLDDYVKMCLKFVSDYYK